MPRYVVLLRGINVGGRNRLPMADLRRVAAGLGWAGVRTHVASGNLVCDAPEAAPGDLADALAAALRADPGLDVGVMAFGADAFRAILRDCPWPDAPGTAVHGWLCAAPPDPDRAAIEALRAPSESIEFRGLCTFLHAPDGIGRSRLAERLERLLGTAATARNLNTLRRLAEMLDG